MPADELTRLALSARDGDRGALEDLVARTQAEVWRLCAHLGARHAADDLTQETFIRALRALPAFRGEASARTWLLTIARNTCADSLRRLARQRALVDRAGREQLGPPRGDDPAGAFDLHLLLSDLDEPRRAAFVLTQVLGLAYTEAADICACPVGTIRSRVARARADLLEMLADPDAVPSERPGAADGNPV